MLRHPLRVLPLVFVVTGCSPAATDLVSIALSDTSSVELDSDCFGDCIDEVSLQVTFEEHIAVDPTEQVEFLQYKVDYAFDGVQVSSLADTTSATVSSGETGFIDFLPASWEQQDEVYAAVGGDYLSGTGVLTLEGYDWRNELLSVTTQFTISFEDLAED